MDWENENWVKVYTRDTGDIMAIGWEGRAVLWELMRKVDRAGVLDEADDSVIAEMLRLPHDVTEVGLARLKKRLVIERTEEALVLVNFLTAQEARSSNKQRQSEFRARRRAMARIGQISHNVTTRVTGCNADVTKRYDEVTGNNEASHEVTSRVEESRVEESREGKEGVGTSPDASPPRKKKSGPSPKLITETARTVVEAFNGMFERSLSSKGSEDQVKKLLAKGYTEPEMRGVMWWAGQEWGEDPEWRMRVSPTTLLKLTSAQGNRTFPVYLDLASELWRSTQTEPVPWEKT